MNGEGQEKGNAVCTLTSSQKVFTESFLHSVRTTLSPFLEPTLATGFSWGKSPTRLLQPIHPFILPRPEEMVLRGAEIAAAPRASPEILENTGFPGKPPGSPWNRSCRGLLEAPWGAEARTQAHPELLSHRVPERGWSHNPTPSREPRTRRPLVWTLPRCPQVFLPPDHSVDVPTTKTLEWLLQAEVTTSSPSSHPKCRERKSDY